MKQQSQTIFTIEIEAKSASTKAKEDCLNTLYSMMFKLDGKEPSKEGNPKKVFKVKLSSNEEQKIKTLMYLQSILFTTKQICSQNNVETFEIKGNVISSLINENYLIKDSTIRKNDGSVMFPTLLKRLEQAFSEQYLEEYKTSSKVKIKGA